MDYGTTIGSFDDPIDGVDGAFDFVEITLSRSVLAEIDTESVADRLDAANLDCTVHLPTTHALVSPVPEVRDGVLAFLDRALETAGELGARRAVAHATTPAFDPADPERLTTTVERLADRAASHGVELVVENLGHMDRGYELATVGRSVAAADAALCLDTGHAFLEADNDAIERIAARHADRIQHVHLHDARNRGDSHIPLGTGGVDPAAVAPLFEADSGSPRATDAGEVTVAVEVFTPDSPLLTDTIDRFRAAVGDGQ